MDQLIKSKLHHFIFLSDKSTRNSNNSIVPFIELLRSRAVMLHNFSLLLLSHETHHIPINNGRSWQAFLGYHYTMRFIRCDSIQSRSLVSDRFETKIMTWLELKRAGVVFMYMIGCLTTIAYCGILTL